MKNAEAGSSSRDDFNDSDDAFVFKNPNMKRKMKAVSPKLRKRKAPERTQLSKSVSSQTNKLPRKHPLNKSAPVASVKNKSKNDKGQSTLSPYFKPENSKDSGLKPEGEPTESEPIDISESPPSPPALDVDGNIPEVENLEVSVPPSNELESTPAPDEKSPKKTCWNLLLNKSPKVESFLCPLCQKKFEKSSQHVSHIKQCAKKKKIPTSELVRIIEGSKPSGSSTGLGVIQKNIPSASEKENDRLAAEDLALAAALSLSMSETSGPGNSRIDKRILDSQKSTLERYGFTSTTSATGIPRKRKIKRVGTPVLTTRTAEERTRLLTEKAAVILLSQQESCFNRRKSAEDNQISSQFPYVAQDNRLWDLGEAEETGTWYLHDMKPFISPEKPMNRGNRQSPKTSQNTLQESPLEIEDPLPPERTKVGSEEKRGGSLAEDWGRLVGNEELSDAVVETLDGQVAVHSLVLAVRCPGVTAAHLAAPCLTMSSTSLLACLHYVYTGTWELTLSCDLDDALTIARVLGRKDLVKIVSQALTESNGSSQVIPSSVSPKYAEGGGFEVDLGSDLGSPDGIMRENGEKDVAVGDRKVELRADPLETADTVPVEENEVHPDPTTGVIVDLTLCGSGSSTSSYGDENSVKQSKEQSDERISMFLSSLGSQHNGVLKHTAEDHGEKEASFNASQNNECIDLFDDEMEIIPHESPKANNLPGVEEESRTGVIKFNPSSQARLSNPPTVTSTDDDVKIVSAPVESTAEIICLSSDSDQNEPCGDPKDEDENNRVITSPPIPSNLSQAFHETTPPARVQSQNEEPVDDEPFLNDISLWEPPENDVNDVVIDFPRTPSQNLVTPKPQSPRKVLESPSKRIAESPELESPKDTTPKSSAWSELRNSKMRKSVARNRVSWSSRRRNSRVGCRKSLRPAQDAMLSESVINALDEPFFDEEPTAPGVPEPSVVTPATPCLDNRPFVEVTPCITPSTRMVDNPSPRPSFSAMKTGSIKKHLQRYGLKKSLSKVKAKKILKHFYEELHPVVNTATGKLVKFLPKDEAASRGGKAKARGGKVPARGRTKASVDEPVASTSRAVFDPQPSTSKEGNVGRSDDDQCAAAVEDVSSGSEVSEDEISGVEEGDFEYKEDDVLTQPCSTTMTVKEAVKKYIRDHKVVHIDVLMYKPVWVETFRKDLQEYLKVKFKLLDIMTCLDELCIAFRSEAQAASNQKRNARKAARRVKKKAPAGKKS